MVLMLWSLFEEMLSLVMSPNIYAASFVNFYLCLTPQDVLEYWVKGPTTLLGMVSKFLSASFFKAMSKELNG